MEILYKYLKTNPVKAFLQHAKNYMQPVPWWKFSTPCKNSTPIFCRADKRALSYLQSKLIHFIENLQVERKLRLCQEFLDVFGRVDPGQATDWWAVTQLEAIGAKAVLLQRDLESGKIPASAFKEGLIGRVTSVVKFPPLEFKIQFTVCTRLMRISLEWISLLRFFKTFQKCLAYVFFE